MLWLASYVFLLRLHSEALPMVKGSSGGQHGEHSVVFMGISCIHLELASRKNKPHGSLLRRSCWCSKNKHTCPVHVLGEYVNKAPAGCKLFPSFTKISALYTLRARLKELGVENAGDYRTQDFRRGHAKDLQVRGAGVKEILAAGEWGSPAYLKYQDLELLEHNLVIQGHLYNSSDED